MKKLYSLFCLVMCLIVTLGCEDDYRSMVLFEGVEPIYQVGTCDNLVSHVRFYLSEAEEALVLGIDGGDGSYQVVNEHETVASVTFAAEVNGYQRIAIEPLAAGETLVRVMDGSGESAQLYVTVRDRRQITMEKTDIAWQLVGSSMEVPGEIEEALAHHPWLDKGGYYVLVPDADCVNFLDRGVLEIYPTGQEKAPLVGSYDTLPMEDENGKVYPLWQFTYKEEQRLFSRAMVGTEGSDVIRFVLSEDVTSLSPSGLLPEGTLVVCHERFKTQMN